MGLIVGLSQPFSGFVRYSYWELFVIRLELNYYLLASIPLGLIVLIVAACCRWTGGRRRFLMFLGNFAIVFGGFLFYVFGGRWGYRDHYRAMTTALLLVPANLVFLVYYVRVLHRFLSRRGDPDRPSCP
ncbi:hypothetical protein DRQ32_11120 [bacterium]|nr:MAG: hypothetical protein DRQ32_11120 [bacterium]